MSAGLLVNEAPNELCELAQQCGVALWTALPDDALYSLNWMDDRLCLIPCHGKERIEVDFIAGASAHRRKFGGGRGQPVAKAVGIKGDYLPRILDATAGQGRDAFVLASLGCELTLLERNPLAWLLLHDGLRRASLHEETAMIAQRMRLIHGDTRLWLNQAGNTQGFDVVYLDPMFPEPDKRAKSKKEMAAFQLLIGGDEDANELLAPARRIAGKRVVVKRPRHAPWLAGEKPGFVYEGESTRFDAYLPQTDQKRATS